MDNFFKAMNMEPSECPFIEQDIQSCPFLRNINKPTSFSFPPVNLPIPVRGAKGPIFEDGSAFDTAFNLFHGKNGVVPLSGRSKFRDEDLENKPAPLFNPLAAKAATISLSSLGLGMPFNFGPFFEKSKQQKKKNSESSNKRESSSKGGNTSNHEAQGNEWLQSGNCPIAKSYRAVNNVLPLVAKVLQPPPGMKFKCPPAVVAARAALARTALVKTLRPQPLHSKMLAIVALGMAVNVPLGIWREHTQKFSLSWFVAVHAAVPFIAMLRKSVLMPKTAMAITVAASIIGQVIGSRAERVRMESVAERLVTQTAIVGSVAEYGPEEVDTVSGGAGDCRKEGIMWGPGQGWLHVKGAGPTSSANVCY